MTFMAQDISRIILPCDWKTFLKEKKGSLFCMYKSPKGNSINGKLLFNTNPTDNKIDFKADLCGFANIGINYRDNILNLSIDVEKIKSFISFQAPVKTFKQKKSIYCIDVTNGGLGISSDSDSNVFIWTTKHGEIRRELNGHFGDAYSCRFFPSGVVALTGGADTQLKIWTVENGQCVATLIGHQRAITDLDIVEKGRNIISASKDGCVRLWDVGEQKCLFTFHDDCEDIINCIHLVSTPLCQDYGGVKNEREVGTENKMLLVGRETKIFQAFSLNSRSKIFSLNTTEAVNCCASLTDHLVAFGCQDSTISLVDLRNNGNLLDTTRHSRSAILSLKAKDSKSLFVTTADGSCFLLDIKDLNNFTEFTGSDCEAVYKSSTDQKYLYTCCRDGCVRKYRVKLR